MNGNKKIFIDTEFTDFIDISLISLGMVADSGEELYIEVPYPAKTCSAFVREVVLPMLGREPNAACAKDEVCSRVMNWLQLVKNKNQDIDLCFDSQHDWNLFGDAIDYRTPPWLHGRNVERNINELLRFEWHEKNKQPEHHALYDARANRYAYRDRPPAAHPAGENGD